MTAAETPPRNGRANRLLLAVGGLGAASVIAQLVFMREMLGAFAGKLGDARSLGFLAETERQVEAHLDHHLEDLPKRDAKSLAIVQQMKIDEMSHAEAAVNLGAQEMPAGIKTAMRLAASVMTRTAYYL